MDKPLTLSDLHWLADLLRTVQAGEPITWLDEVGNTRWGISRALVKDDAGKAFLGTSDDVREAFVWLSGGNHFGEVFYPVQGLLTGLDEGRASLGYRPE